MFVVECVELRNDILCSGFCLGDMLRECELIIKETAEKLQTFWLVLVC